MQSYIDSQTLSRALERLHGTAGHLLKIWLTLKHMGLGSGQSVEIDTANSTPALRRLFDFGDPERRFYIPFSHTPRYSTMKSDAARSIIQTNIQRWASSGSVVTCDPTEYLEITSNAAGKLVVRTSRRYPLGLGINESGFAIENGMRVSLPLSAFAVWYGRRTPIPADTEPRSFLIGEMLRELHLTSAERDLVFIQDDLLVSLSSAALSDSEIFTLCSPFISGERNPSTIIVPETFDHYSTRVRSMTSSLDKPMWLRRAPGEQVAELVEGGAKAILLFGPPRTGKTRHIDLKYPRTSEARETIQIHDGWGYDNLIQGLKPLGGDSWGWQDGPLKAAIKAGKKFIVLEEINRTVISQALGEVFSLIEESYRGEENGIILRNGEKFFIPNDVVFFMTMNTLDKSTEEVDDALLGRVASVEFPPRPEDLLDLLTGNSIDTNIRQKIGQLYASIIEVYPLGHGYFAALRGNVTAETVLRHYSTRIRPVLVNFFGDLNADKVANIDNMADQLFGAG